MPEEDNNNEELRPTKMRGVVFPKAKYGVIVAVIIIICVNLILYKETILGPYNNIRIPKIFICTFAIAKTHFVKGCKLR